jgi:hypothetical protein
MASASATPGAVGFNSPRMGVSYEKPSAPFCRRPEFTADETTEPNAQLIRLELAPFRGASGAAHGQEARQAVATPAAAAPGRPASRPCRRRDACARTSRVGQSARPRRRPDPARPRGPKLDAPADGALLARRHWRRRSCRARDGQGSRGVRADSRSGSAARAPDTRPLSSPADPSWF